jgi:soluble lytic murein transglycosylase-like protein
VPASPRLVALAVAALVGAGAAFLLLRSSGEPVPTVPGVAKEIPDPFAWAPQREDEFVSRAARGAAHGLYAFSPGGVEATAERTERWRVGIERAAGVAGIEPDLLEGLVFLESAGREDAVTAVGLEGAVGLTQILAETAQNLLGMRVDLEASRRLTRQIQRALRRGHLRAAERLRRERRRVDERFDPEKALAGAGRYLKLARERFERDDLAVVSYHMGMGNLENVLAAYGERDLSYARLYFDSTPTSHPEAYERLTSLGDDSSNYYWKVLAAREIMHLYRTAPERLALLSRLQNEKNSAEEVLHPEDQTVSFADEDELEEAYERGDLIAFPPRPPGLRRHRRMGELSERPALYRGLRPEAMALALYVAAQVKAISGEEPLIVTSTVRDREYQRRLVRRNGEATRSYSLHTTGWAFDVLREYASREQALAFQFVLDRLELLDVIAWVREPAAIHVTAGADAERLLALLETAG